MQSIRVRAAFVGDVEEMITTNPINAEYIFIWPKDLFGLTSIIDTILGGRRG